MPEFSSVCRDPYCRAHGRFLRRIRRLVCALTVERQQLALTERALDVNSDEVIRLQEWLEFPERTPVLDVTAPDQKAEAARYAAEVETWHRWMRGPARDERGMGWERAHTTMCSAVPCREHRNPYQRSRGAVNGA